MVPLKYYSIEKVVRKETASVLWLKGISYPFAVPRPPLPEFAWAVKKLSPKTKVISLLVGTEDPHFVDAAAGQAAALPWHLP